MLWQGGRWGDLLALVATGPGGTHFEEAVGRLGSWVDTKEYHSNGGPTRGPGRVDLHDQLLDVRAQADEYKGTPAEVMIGEVAGKLCLYAERPEQAAEVLGEALGRIEEGRALRGRLVALRQEALEIADAKRRGIDPGSYGPPAGP